MVANTAATRVTGHLKRKIIRDISIGLGSGVVAGYAWWHLYHVKSVQKRDQWYVQYAKDHPEDE